MILEVINNKYESYEGSYTLPTDGVTITNCITHKNSIIRISSPKKCKYRTNADKKIPTGCFVLGFRGGQVGQVHSLHTGTTPHYTHLIGSQIILGVFPTWKVSHSIHPL